MVSILLLCWAVLSLYTAGTCHPLQQASSPSNAVTSDPEAHRQFQNVKEETGRERLRKTLRCVFKGNKSSRCFLMIDGTFLCLDSRGRFYVSISVSHRDSRFHHVRQHKQYDVVRAWKAEVLISFRRSKANRYSHNSQKHHKKGTRRRRRSWHTDPSDPLGSEHPNTITINDHRREPAVVSKETITAVDDPLEVLLSYIPLTPTMERHRINRKVRY